MKVVAVTPSGGRPVQLGWCREMMLAQTRKPDLHIVSEDESLSVPKHFIKVFTEALDAGAETILLIEDDDHYPPEYVEQYLTVFELGWNYIGSSQTRYYNLASRSFVLMNHPRRSSACATAFTAKGASLFLRVLEGCNTPFADIEMWKAVQELDTYLFRFPTMTGIKGLPGRPGAGVGHRVALPLQDREGLLLERWVGPAWAARYLSFMQSVAS